MSEFPKSSKKLERLKFIEELVYIQGFINREDLQHHFGISAASATNDLSMYDSLAAKNIRYNVKKKSYEIGKSFERIFPPSILRQRLPLYTMPRLHAFLDESSLEPVGKISRAIQNREALEISYRSASSDQPSRQIVPVALADNLLRWHVRAFDRNRRKFCNFVVHQIESVKILGDSPIEEHEHPDKDCEWHKFVTLKITTHSFNLQNSETFEMGNQIRKIRIRAAMAGYFLQIWNIDCSPNESLRGKQYQFRLTNVKEVSNVADLTIAPGFVDASC